MVKFVVDDEPATRKRLPQTLIYDHSYWGSQHMISENISVHAAQSFNAPMPFGSQQAETLLHEYLRSLRVRRRSSAHLERVDLSVRRFIKWLTTIPGPTLSIDLIEEFALWLMDSARPFAGTSREGEPGSLSVASQRAYLIDLRSFLKWCASRNYVPSSSYRWVPVPQPQKNGIKRASNVDIRRILQVARENLRDYAICCLLIDCGMRAGELGSMRIEQCDIENRAVAVTGKTGYRTIAISKQAAGVLAQWLACREEESGYVFPGRSASHLSANGIYQIMVRLRNRAGAKGRVNPHAWRHAYISNTAVRGGNAALTQVQAGHASISTTEQYFGFGLAELRDYQERVTALPELTPAQPPVTPVKEGVLPRPCQEELAEAIRSCQNWQALGRRYGVSGVAVKKWAIKWGLIKHYTRNKTIPN